MTDVERVMEVTEVMLPLVVSIFFSLLGLWGVVQYITLIPPSTLPPAGTVTEAIEYSAIYVLGASGIFITFQGVGIVLGFALTTERGRRSFLENF